MFKSPSVFVISEVFWLKVATKESVDKPLLTAENNKRTVTEPTLLIRSTVTLKKGYELKKQQRCEFYGHTHVDHMY